MTLNLKALKKPSSSTVNKDNDADYTGDGEAPQRVMFLNLGFFRYGTNDKAHGAAIVLALILLALMGLVYFYGGDPIESKDKFLTWLGSAFLFVSGVAVGKSSKSDD